MTPSYVGEGAREALVRLEFSRVLGSEGPGPFQTLCAHPSPPGRPSHRVCVKLISRTEACMLQMRRLLVIGGSFGLREFSQIRYDAVKIKIDPELEKKLKMNKVSLESEYEKIKDSTFGDWTNIRGPRPWEDPNLLQGRNSEALKSKTT
ncbi:cytochrome c oxidase assembly protein COX16 homolog, mitochondrial isoform X1 [Echinops telfairi]|uniref:Cytochrome c oxidase assembly protein COX16 homolog, mitochondrial isoform X1 n=1 Tax=Echinops telfairi TaxID=9371 RepID=A0AC55CWE4_ECHTE|nr:cytochrome c oxidase assembly protein COX16 homolog, mitochondrial isoform X1 [Echinops telfairi]